MNLLPVAGLSTLNGFGPQDNFHASRNASSGKFTLHLLDAHLLKVDKARFAHVKGESTSVVAHGITTNGRLGVLELLLNIGNGRLTISTDKSANNQLWVHWMSAHNLTGNPYQASNAKTEKGKFVTLSYL